MKVTSIAPVDAVTGAGSAAAPEKLPSSGAAVVLPPYTLTKSKLASVLNAENVSVTAEPVLITHAHCALGA